MSGKVWTARVWATKVWTARVWTTKVWAARSHAGAAAGPVHPPASSPRSRLTASAPGLVEW